VRNCEIFFCGGGVKVLGGNSNGCIFDWINLNKLALGRTDVDAEAYLNQSPERWGTGGYCVWDASLGGASVRHIYGQTSAGCPFRNDRLGGAGAAGIWLFCTAEVAQKSYFLNAPVVIQVSPTSDTSQAVILGAECSGLQFADRIGTLMKAQIAGGGQLYQFSVDLDSPYIWRWNHDGTDWGLQYGAAQPHALTLFGVQRGSDPGLGWLGFKRGFLIGDPDGLLYRGPLASIGQPEGRLFDTNLRAGARKAGDKFEGASSEVILTGDGYRGYRWDIGAQVVPGNEPYGNPPSLVEPQENGPCPQPGASGRGPLGTVWKALTYGTTGAGEPDWSTAVPGGGTLVGDQVVDNDVTWELVGFTPAWDVEQRVEKTTMPTRMAQIQTTTSDPDQVLLDANVVDAFDFVLPIDSMVHVCDVILVKKSATADGGSIKIESDWIRNGSATPVQIGAAVVTYNLSGASLDGTTVAHVENAGRIELQASPESADTLNWRIFRTQATGRD
jgi:hypothetical protein